MILVPNWFIKWRCTDQLGIDVRLNEAGNKIVPYQEDVQSGKLMTAP